MELAILIAVSTWMLWLVLSVALPIRKVPPTVVKIKDCDWGTEHVFRPILFPEFHNGPVNPYGYQEQSRKPVGYGS